MPEKVHVKFGDATGSQSPAAEKRPVFSSPKSKQPPHLIGVKRTRDGSPKAKASSEADLKHSKVKSTLNHKNGTEHRKEIREKSRNGTRGLERTNERKGETRSTKALLDDVSNHQYKSNAPTGNEQSGRQKLLHIAQEHEKVRKLLPIWPKKQDIRRALRHNDVLLINGETGSGKSTQVPQFLYTEPWCKRQIVKVIVDGEKTEDVAVGGMIAITQPRRIAATTLARRVASEVGSPFTGNVGEVGYAVRFDSFLPTGTKIKFMTEGMLLQEMLHDPNLRKYSAVIVDEIHERSIDVDLIAGFLRRLVHGDKAGRGGVPLKVVVMSATLDLEGIRTFFAKPGSVPRYESGQPSSRMPAPVRNGEIVRGLSDKTISSLDGLGDSKREPSQYNAIQQSRTEPDGVAVEYVRGRQHEVQIIHETKPSQDYMHTILQTVLQLHVTESLPGDILVFLTGQDEIESLRNALVEYAEKLAKTLPRMKIMPLYGALSAAAQQEAFERVKEKFTRKIVLATNIAETSVTVSGVRFVVDCGKSKVKQYRSRLGMESLLSKPISRVSAIQRAGRAGREAKGKCFRIYTEDDYKKLDQHELPEILRSDVVEAVLKMKSRGIGDVLNFQLMDSPDTIAVQNALKQLHMMGAVDDEGFITAVGKKMAIFPLPATYGRVLIAAAEPNSDILLEVIDVIACLTTDSEIFNQPKSEDDQENISEVRKDLLSPDGDIITLLAVIRKYATVSSADRLEWCKQRLIAPRAMKTAIQIRQQLRQICYQQKLLTELPPAGTEQYEALSPERVVILLKTFMTAFAAKTALLAPDGSYMMIVGRHPITIHPSSVLFGQRKSEAIMFLEHVFTAKNYAKKVSPVQANWIEEAFQI
ncbi:hypothetical protein VTL71DRAFT_4263 [Oculimacula yallundae]|uniref:RNA helicase n=1 Tax=Oculimacula yallundae TaxID=86028 RepID=A0ABR4C7M0_9HELO